jgi:hypothetical protein
LSIWNDMFCLSGLMCFVYLEWYVLSVWNDMFCLSGMICFFYLDWYFLDWTYHSRQTKHINPDRQNILIRMDRTYHSRQTKHIIPGMICFFYLDWYVLSNLDWYVLSVWIDMFCLSGLICFVYLEWYVLSVWNDMFCPSGLRWYHSRQTNHIIPDRQNTSIQTDKTYHSR